MVGVTSCPAKAERSQKIESPAPSRLKASPVTICSTFMVMTMKANSRLIRPPVSMAKATPSQSEPV